MEELMDELGRKMSCPAALGRTLRDGCDSGLVAKHLNVLTTRLIEGDERHLRQTNARSMVLAQRGDTILQVRRIGGPQTHVDRLSEAERYVHTAPSNSVLVIRGSAPVTVNRYRLPPGTDRAGFQADIELEPLGSERYDGSYIVEQHDDDEIRDYRCEAGEAWMVRLNYPPYATETWFFEKSTLRSVFASAVLADYSSLVTLCRVFGAQHDEEAKPIVEELARNEAHFVRWAAVQAMGQIDAERARQMIEERCEDPHPHIQQAARSALKKLGGS
jgi:HEAT repeats